MTAGNAITRQAPGVQVLRRPFGRAGEAALARALAEGRVMAYPTETSYALGGNALDAALVERVFRLKGRAAEKAVLLLVDGTWKLDPYARGIEPAARLLMERFWPGALTLVFHAAPGLPAHLTGPRGTVALRWCPRADVAELLRIGAAPLIGTSANRSGRPAAHSLAEVLTAFGAGVELAIDGGPTPGGAPSTLLDTTVRPFRLLREGAVPAAALREALRAAFPQWMPAE